MLTRTRRQDNKRGSAPIYRGDFLGETEPGWIVAAGLLDSVALGSMEFARKVSYALQELIGSSRSRMKTTKFTYWQDGDHYLGFLNDYRDYPTQGMSKQELVSNLRNLLLDLESGEIPYIRKVEELVLAD